MPIDIQQTAVVGHVGAVLGALVKAVAEFFERGGFAGGKVAQEEHGLLGLGEAEPDRAVVMDVNEIARSEGLTIARNRIAMAGP